MHTELHTAVVVQELFDGRAVAFPVADPSLRSFCADPETALEEQQAFLEEYLLAKRPEEQARFSLPDGVELREVEVDLPRPDLPARLQLDQPLALAVVVIPQRRDRWVLVPALEHTFHLSPGEDLEQEVGAEARRMVVARQLSPQDFSALLPCRATRLERVTLTLRREEHDVGRARSRRREVARRRRQKDAARVLESIGRPLHLVRRDQDKPLLVARETELAQLRALIGGRQRLSVMVVAPPLCGKTALIEAWAAGQLQNTRENNKSEAHPVFATSAAQLVAGMSGLGQWQERVRRVMEAARLLDVVLYIDNLGDLFGDHPGGLVDIAGAMRPFLDEERVRVVAEVRPEALDLLQSRHPGFIGGLHRLGLAPLSADQTGQVLRALVQREAKRRPARPRLDPAAVPHLVDLVDRYLPYQHYPGKAVVFWQELMAMEERVTGSDEGPPVGEQEVYRGFAVQSGIPVFLLRRDQAMKLDQVLGHLRRRVKGQGEALERVARTLCVIKAQLQPREKPLSSFLFVGPTGVGKTEVARALAGFLFGSQERLLRFDMSEYGDPLAADRLIRGGERSEGELTRRVRQQPFCVLLLDEVEKAHPAVFDLLLGVLGEGRLTDTAGRTAYFHNAIIIMTSNLGAAHRRQLIGLEGRQQSDEAYYMDQVRASFRPEFVGRLDRVIPFHPLTGSQTEEVARLMLERMAGRRGLAEVDLTLTLSDAALALLARMGTSGTYGARQLRRHLEDLVLTPAAGLLARQVRAARGGRLELTLADEEAPSDGAAGRVLAEEVAGPLRLRLKRGTGRRGAGTSPLRRISGNRREAARLMRMEEVDEVREQLEYLVAQLSTLGERRTRRGRRPDSRLQRELRDLAAEHRRLDGVWGGAEGIMRDLASAEELAMEALAAEEDLAPYLEESAQLLGQLNGQLFHLLTALHPRPGGITLLVQELDGGRALDSWLLPLLAQLSARRWSVTAHLDGERPGPGDHWPVGRRWGPPRDAGWLRELLGRPERDFSALLLRLSGAAVGVALAVEAGLHAFPWPGQGTTPTRMFVRHLVPRTTLTDEEWASPHLEPANPSRASNLRRTPPARRYLQLAGPCLLRNKQRSVAVPHGQYWQRHEEIAAVDIMVGLDNGLELAEWVAGDLPPPDAKEAR